MDRHNIKFEKCYIKMHNGKYQCRMAASCTYDLPAMESRDEATESSCTRDNAEADYSYSISLSAQTMKVMVIV